MLCLLMFSIQTAMKLAKKELYILTLFLGFIGISFAQSDSIPPQAQELYNQGVTASEQSQWADAERFYSEAIGLAPTFTKAFQNRAFTLLELKKETEAKKDFESWIQLDPQAHVAHFELGILAEKSGQLAEAALQYQKAFGIKSEAKYAYQLGVCQFNQKKFEEAVQAFSTCIKQDDKHVFAFHDRGSANRELGKLSEAISDYQKATELNPKFALGWNNLGTAYRKKGDFKLAVQAYQKATQLESSNYLYWNNLGFAQSEGNELDAAIQSFQKVIQLKADYSFAHANLGGIFIKQQKYKEAVLACDKAIQLDAENGSAWYNRGVAKEMLRDAKGACSDWEKAAELGVANAQTYFQTSDCSNQ